MAVTSPVAATPATRTGEPVAASERIQTVDILRGFALLGILLVNMAFFKSVGFYAAFGSAPTATGGIDQVARWFIQLFAEGKFYTLFSFLFGFGFAIQMLRAEARGERFGPRYTRRLLVLLVFGIGHSLLLWYGDILKSYALIGFVLLLFRNRAPRTLLIWAGACLFAVTIITVGFLGLAMVADGAFATTPQGNDPTTAWFQSLDERATEAYRDGTFAQLMQQRLIDNAFALVSFIFSVPSILAMFLLGLYAGRRGIFQDVAAHTTLLRRVMVWGLVLGLLLNGAYVWGKAASSPTETTGMDLLSVLGQTLGGPVLSLGYAAAITLLVQRANWRRRLAPIAAVGRMALSNYLFQSIVCTTIFYSYGFGLFGQVGAAAGMLLSLVIYALQIPLSVWWMRRFRFGPAEWVWRSLTYGRRQPIRV
jgi:uncharacterized protein